MPAKPFKLALFYCALAYLSGASRAAEPDFASAAPPLFKQFCFDCHGSDVAEGQIQLEQLAADPAFNVRFKKWEKIAAMLESGQMPPKEAPQPTADQRKLLAALVRQELRRANNEHAGDPGDVVLRRLTSAEYAYTIQDLTGLDLDLEREFVSDAAGGEGFTNVGSVQFLDDSGLERYLEAAKQVAARATIGAGPLKFFADPGKTGQELSAIHRLNRIYQQHGFRTAAGEGGEPFGLDRYPKAFFTAWRYQHRDRLGLAGATLEKLAAEERLPPRFVEHIWTVLTAPSSTFPTSEIVNLWRELPTPAGGTDETAKVRARCEELYRFMADRQARLAKAVGNEEEAAILSETSVQVEKRHVFVARFPWLMDPPPQAHVQFSVISGDPSRNADAVVIWRNPRLRFRQFTRRREEPPLLTAILSEEAARPFAFGRHPRGGQIGESDFVTIGAESRTLELPTTPGARGVEVQVEVELDLKNGEDCVVRCSITEGTEVPNTKTVSALLADPAGQPFHTWKSGVIEFARLLPQVSHREPAPSDRDPIPFPFDNTYNAPERDFFHSHVKYQRDDAFFIEYMLDDDARRHLDDAWTDLLGSFEYHDILLRFVADKYKLDLAGRTITTIDDKAIDALPAEPRDFLRQLRQQYVAIQERLLAAQPRHLTDALAFAGRAWRRPLSEDEKSRLTSFYHNLRQQSKLDHTQALQTLLTRILVAPEFLYRAERPATDSGNVALSDWELANRLSYFLWSSLPDDELRRAATSSELHDPNVLAQQTRRLLRDPKARRLATEFFGQWLGFYQFDRFRGIDPEKFPEFTDRLKTALYDEATCFFEHIVRDDRPLKDILFADYAFLNDDLAKHYGIPTSSKSPTFARFEQTDDHHRGGLLGLGAVLTVTSAPLRTSPVKRGDWVLRRILGTPVPPPPANAGSIAADESPADGQTVRKRLESHRREVTCANCHSRIDPLGFALEHFDPLGRWRDTYRNDEPIEDNLPLADGTPLSGLAGLKSYLQEHQDQFYDTLATKLLAYALGRGELASDERLMKQMMADVKSGDGRLSGLIVDIVASQQFQHRRAQLQSPPQVSATGRQP